MGELAPKKKFSMTLTIICAVAENGGIGFRGGLLYRLSADLRRFKALTSGHTVLMGRKTFESLPKGALPNRRNMVVSHQENFTAPGIEVFHSMEEALQACTQDEEVYAIGGESIYKAALNLADRLCLTHIHAMPEEADTFFPPWNREDWIEVSREEHKADEKNAADFAFVDYVRRETTAEHSSPFTSPKEKVEEKREPQTMEASPSAPEKRKGSRGRIALLSACLLLAALSSQAEDRVVKLTFMETSDVHGNYFPYDFIQAKEGEGSLARVATYVKNLRQEVGEDAVVLLDNGDILQGQPTAYFYNFVDTTSTHLCAQMLNFLDYDAATVGNHDIEAGHGVYDRWISQCNFPMLGANILRTDNGQPYLQPYTIIERQGIKVAVLGLLTPAIPNWLSEKLWEGLQFDDMAATAKKYMAQMQEQADLVVGLFHSGKGQAQAGEEYAENASAYLASSVPGFHIVFCGHDHRRASDLFDTPEGRTTLLLNPGADAKTVARVDVELKISEGELIAWDFQAKLEDVSALEPDKDFMDHFAKQYDQVRNYTSEKVGQNNEELLTLPALFGPAPLIDFVHKLQLEISGADISFTAPLSLEAKLPEGDVHVSDLFNLYKYENLLYLMTLSGQEVKDYLEYSYAGWTKQMNGKDDHMLLFVSEPEAQTNAWSRLQTPVFNFDSAAGIIYTVDLSKPEGKKIQIKSMADGRPFRLTDTYKVAINSYRGNGGGDHLTKGAGIPKEELPNRIVWSTDRDLRHYFTEAIRKAGSISSTPLNHWKFIPERWVKQAAPRDSKLMKE